MPHSLLNVSTHLYYRTNRGWLCITNIKITLPTQLRCCARFGRIIRTRTAHPHNDLPRQISGKCTQMVLHSMPQWQTPFFRTPDCVLQILPSNLGGQGKASEPATGENASLLSSKPTWRGLPSHQHKEKNLCHHLGRVLGRERTHTSTRRRTLHTRRRIIHHYCGRQFGRGHLPTMIRRRRMVGRKFGR